MRAPRTSKLYGKRDRIASTAARALGAGLVGTPELVAERMRRYEEIGVELFLMHFHPMLEGLDNFAAKVMPSCLGLEPRCRLRGDKVRVASDPFALFPFRAIVDHPPVAWPNGARVAVWVVPNIEHFHVEIGNAAPDIRNHSRRDYGNRVGVWRLMEVLEKNGVRGTVALNGEVGKYYPRIMEACDAPASGS